MFLLCWNQFPKSCMVKLDSANEYAIHNSLITLKFTFNTQKFSTNSRFLLFKIPKKNVIRFLFFWRISRKSGRLKYFYFSRILNRYSLWCWDIRKYADKYQGLNDVRQFTLIPFTVTLLKQRVSLLGLSSCYLNVRVEMVRATF